MTIHVRPARGAEPRLCRMLLGEEGSVHPDRHLFVAVDESDRPLGTGTVRSGVESIGEPWSVHVHTLPSSGSGPAEAKLLEYAKCFAAVRGAKILQTMRWFESGSENERRWMSLGFIHRETRQAHEVEVGKVFMRMMPLFQQVRDHGWIPPEATTIPLAEADLQRVCELHLKYLGGPRRHLLSRLDGTAMNSFDRQASVVLLYGQQTMGFTLGWFPEPGVCEISANVLDPAVRFGWANVLLKFDALQRVIARNATMFRFVTRDGHTDSRRTSKWLGPGTTRVEVRLQCDCNKWSSLLAPNLPIHVEANC